MNYLMPSAFKSCFGRLCLCVCLGRLYFKDRCSAACSAAADYRTEFCSDSEIQPEETPEVLPEPLPQLVIEEPKKLLTDESEFKVEPEKVVEEKLPESEAEPVPPPRYLLSSLNRRRLSLRSQNLKLQRSPDR